MECDYRIVLDVMECKLLLPNPSKKGMKLWCNLGKQMKGIQDHKTGRAYIAIQAVLKRKENVM